jgi:RND superfamily putative drug exporter
VGRRIAARPRTVWVGTTVVLLVACLGLLRLDASGLSSDQQYTKKFDSIRGQAVLTEHGMVDTSSPIMVVANAAQATQVQDAMAGVGDGLGQPSRPVVKGDTALITQAVPGDVAGAKAFDQVKEVRAAVHAVPGADALVGGTSAIYLDTNKASSHDNRVILPVTLLVVMLILMLLLRAVLAPVILIATVILSFGAALGISTMIFRGLYTQVFSNASGFDHADTSFPLFVFVFLVALGIDYNIFLMTRVREETHDRGTRQGALVALRATGGVITSAGLVLAATFSVLATIPFVFLVEIGTAVALGVMLDTIIVRSVLVTAINLDLGGRIWWPSKLDRVPDESASDAAQKVEALEG